MIDLIDKYQLDLLYFDDLVLPLRKDEKIGLSIAAHLYNTSLKNHNGRNDAVMNTKELNEAQRKCLIYDIERAVSDRVEPFAWQTDTCIGRWFYNNATFKRHSYSKPAAIIRVLVDIVSKNGNLLLNVPIKGDGTIDSDEVAILEDIAKWMTVSSECIFGTRPWKVYGEGRKFAKGSPGDLNKGKGGEYTAEDIRFTTKGNTLYAIALGWPENGQLIIKTLGKNQAGLKGDITSVQLLGSSSKLAWTRSDAALTVTLPAQKPCEYAWALKIEGLDLAASESAECMTIIPFVGKPAK